ncbi:hypothetical protein Hdeb2414_s0006g00212271 [Helianthus debilis subsp. tardiflorus]
MNSSREYPDMRFNIWLLYRNKEYQASEMADGEEAPSVPLEELLDDLKISNEDVVDDDGDGDGDDDGVTSFGVKPASASFECSDI